MKKTLKDEAEEEIIKVDASKFEGGHFMIIEGDGNDTITKVTGMYKDWFWTMLLCNSRTCCTSY
jgi:hypothetical protein